MATTPRTALITGASSGIGRAMARWWAARGATVYAAARRASLLDELAAEPAGDGGGRIVPVTLDVADEARAVAAIQALDDQCGGLDLVIANAGVGDPTPAQLATWEAVERVLRVNVMGAAATITAVLPRMVARGRGHVVGVSSVASYAGLGAYSSYCGSKAFLSIFLQSLQVDLRGTPVRVTCIEPGFVRSEMQAKLEGRAPMPFVAPTEQAADVFGRAIVRGTRRLAWPTVHAVPARAMAWVPAFAYEPIAQRLSQPQVAMAEEALARSKP